MSFYVFNKTLGTGVGSYFQDNDTTASPFIVNQWYFIVGVANGTFTQIWKDGVMRDSDIYTGIISPNNSTANITIGISADTDYWIGAIDDVRIYNRSLTQAEILTLNSSGRLANPDTVSSGLVMYQELDEGAGITILDATTNHIDGILSNTSWNSSGNVTRIYYNYTWFNGTTAVESGQYQNLTQINATIKGVDSFYNESGIVSANLANDTDYATHSNYTSYSNASLYWNYTNLANSTNQTTWQVKHGTAATYNITLPAACAAQATIQLRITANNSNSTAGNANFSAKTTTTWASSAGIGNIAWTNPTQAQASDNSPATAVLAFNASAVNKTVYLNGSGWGFAIPSYAVITGVMVSIRRNVSSTSSRITMDNSVRLQVDGAAAGDDEAKTTQYTTSYVVSDYGGVSNLSATWNTTLTPAQVNAANFGILFSAKATSGTSTRTVNLDFINMTVFYNTSSNYSQTSAYAYNGTAWVNVGINSTATNNFSASDIYEQDVYFNTTSWADSGFANGTEILVNNKTTGITTGNWTFECDSMDSAGNVAKANSSVFVITAATNSCTYSGSGNWLINYTHYCNITTSVNLGANYLILMGQNGTCTIKNGGSVAAKGIYMTPALLQRGSTFAIEIGGKLNLTK